MKGVLFRPDVWKAKLRVLEQYGEAQTRRLGGLKEINKEPDNWRFVYQELNEFYFEPLDKHCIACVRKPRYRIGDIVYIKEAWHYINIPENKATPYDFGVEYADGEIRWWTDNGNEMNYPLDEKKRSPMFLKAKFARYFIQFTGIRLERLQAITEEDAIVEGMYPEGTTKPNGYEAYDDPIEEYAQLWDSINKIHKWNTNPRVFVYSFKRIDRPKYEVLE